MTPDKLQKPHFKQISELIMQSNLYELISKESQTLPSWGKTPKQFNFWRHMWWRSILVIYCCVTNYSKLSGLKQWTFPISQFLRVISPGVAYWGVSGSGYLRRLHSNCHPGLNRGGSVSMFTHVSLSTICLKVFTTWQMTSLSPELSYNIAAGFHQNKWFKREKMREIPKKEATPFF